MGSIELSTNVFVSLLGCDQQGWIQPNTTGNPQINPSSVAVILYGNMVMDEPADLHQAVCVLFGLIYASSM